MGDSLIGVEVPAMKKPEEETTVTSTTTTKVEFEAAADKELLCPICMQMIKDAFLTACGHSFCYMCIVTHLRNKSDCPCCFNSLTPDQLFPNFLLDKVNRIFEHFLISNWMSAEWSSSNFLLIIFNMSILLWIWKEYIILFFLSLQQVRNLCILIHARSSGLNLKIVYFTMQLIVIRFSCATFVAIEEDICPTIIEKFIPCRTISSVIGTGESWFWSIIEVFMI